MMKPFVLGCVFGLIVGFFSGYCMFSYHSALPASQPEKYSKDGCWIRDAMGYWHPERRCHVV